MKKLIKKILREDQREMYLNKIINFMRNDYPLFKNMELYGFYDQLSEEELNYVFSGVFGEPVSTDGNRIYNDEDDILYRENYDGDWEKYEYNENGNEIYRENSNGH